MHDHGAIGQPPVAVISITAELHGVGPAAENCSSTAVRLRVVKIDYRLTHQVIEIEFEQHITSPSGNCASHRPCTCLEVLIGVDEYLAPGGAACVSAKRR